MKLLRWAALPAAFASLTLSSCSGQVTKAAVTPSPVAESPSPQADTFDAGLTKASDASYTAKTAETSEDWDLAVSRWQRAIELMQGVPKNSANYAQAQEKLTGYQRNLTAAQSHTTLKEIASEPIEPARTASSVVPDRTSVALSDSSKDELFLTAIEAVASPEGKTWASDVTRDKKISLAHNACAAFGRGVTFEQLAALAYAQVGNNSVGLHYMGQVIGAGVAVYCPEYRSKLPS